MTPNTLLRSGWQNSKKYLLAALTISAMRTGIVLVLSDAAYPLTRLAFKAINFIIRRGFPDHLLLNESFGPPWSYHLRIASEGLAIFAVGMFLGLWANVGTERQRPSLQEEAPAPGEG